MKLQGVNCDSVSNKSTNLRFQTGANNWTTTVASGNLAMSQPL